MTATVNTEDGEESELLELVAYVSSSRYRRSVVNCLDSRPRQPSRIADENDMPRPHVSRALGELKEKELVHSHSSDSRAKLYTLTERGNEVATRLEEHSDE